MNDPGVKYNFEIEGIYQGDNSLINRNSDGILEEPLESILTYPGYIAKCFTFHSFLQRKWRNLKFKLEYTKLHFKFSPEIVPVMSGDRNYIAFHSPNSLPSIDNLEYINISKDHTYFYIELRTELLGHGYDTDCLEYDLDHQYTNFSMRSDCISSCIQESFEKLAEYRICPVSPYPQKFEKSNQGQLFLPCDVKDWSRENGVNELYFKMIDPLEYKCNEQCKKDCDFIFYVMEPKITFEEFDAEFKINIEHNHLPDVSIKYVPQTSFISFACNFGGLLGMWLGLSIFKVFEHIPSIFTRISRNRRIFYQILNKIRNQYFCKVNYINVNSVNINIKRPRVNLIHQAPIRF